MANFLVDEHPGRGLALLDKANALLPCGDTGLRWLSESLRTECLITLGRVDEALGTFEQAEALRPAQDRPNARLRSAFTTARLLEALGKAREAEALFHDVVAGDLERGLYKDAFLDLLYLFGFHVRQGSPERAVDASLRTLDEFARHGSAVHEQLRSVWERLAEPARREGGSELSALQAPQGR
jgi:tetratricopeptide (TPR) repeat protein